MKKLSETFKELGIAFKYPIEIKDANGENTYYEDSNGYWCKSTYGVSEISVYYEDGTGFKVDIPKSQPRSARGLWW